MTGARVNDYSIGDENIQSLMLTTDKSFKGLHKVSLTNYTTTAAPQIAAGSVIEVGGALYKFDANETITGSPSDGTVYIMIVPGLTTCTAQYTNTAPTWNDANQGWYGTGGSANYRYLFVMTKATAAYSKKRFLDCDYKVDALYVETLTIGNVLAPVNRFQGSLHGTYTMAVLFSTLSPYIPNNGDKMKLVGGGVTNRTFSYVERTSSTRITFYLSAGSALTTMTADDGETGVNTVLSISW